MTTNKSWFAHVTILEGTIVELGTIEQVDLKAMWPHEAADFTPWLAKQHCQPW